MIEMGMWGMVPYGCLRDSRRPLLICISIYLLPYPGPAAAPLGSAGPGRGVGNFAQTAKGLPVGESATVI